MSNILHPTIFEGIDIIEDIFLRRVYSVKTLLLNYYKPSVIPLYIVLSGGRGVCLNQRKNMTIIQ